MTDEDVVRRAAGILGSRNVAHRTDSRGFKDIFIAQIAGQRAANWMAVLYPMMGMRRQAQIYRVFEVCKQPLVISSTALSDELRLHWLVGLLEGEGSFSSGPPSAPNRSVIQMTSTDRDVIEVAAQILEVTVFRNRKANAKHKEAFSIHLRGQQALHWMALLRPHMGLRRQQQIDQAVASSDNQRAARQGEFNRATKLSRSDVLEIYQRLQLGESERALGVEFGVNHTTIGDIDSGKTWGWLTGAKPKAE